MTALLNLKDVSAGYVADIDIVRLFNRERHRAGEQVKQRRKHPPDDMNIPVICLPHQLGGNADNK